MTQQSTTTQLITIFGYGPTGEATANLLRARGTPVRVVQRRRPANLPAGVEFMSCDALDAGQVMRAMQDATQAVVTIGFEYSGKVWERAWPKAMANLLAAAEANATRVVHIDNMYMYGPQTAPIREDMPLTSYGRKPKARANATRMWMEAAKQGRVWWAALRAPDFYGAGVDRSHIGETGLAAIVRGKAANMIMAPDNPHDFAYVPDIARAAVSLLDAPDEDFNQVWHVPCAPTRTPRELLKMGADTVGQKLKVIALPSWLLPVIGLAVPFVREVAEMQFTWNRPYHIDAAKFARRFWSDATPFEVGIPATTRAFRAATSAKTAQAKTEQASAPKASQKARIAG